MPKAIEQTWRTGRKVGRTLYDTPAGAPDEPGHFIGSMDTPELAGLAALAPEMYRTLRALRRPGRPCPMCAFQGSGIHDNAEVHTGCSLADLLRRAEAL